MNRFEDRGVDPTEEVIDRIIKGGDRHTITMLDRYGFGTPDFQLSRREVIELEVQSRIRKKDPIISQEEIDQAKAEFSKRTGWRSGHDHHPA